MTEQQRQWIEMEPVDTLFFRGTESMVAGENHEAQTMFPPMPTTITGALRTALLTQQDISPQAYIRDPGRFTGKHPFLGTPARPGFQVTGPLLKAGSAVLYPAPAHWTAKLDEEMSDGDLVRVQASQPLRVVSSFGLTGSVSMPFWTRRPVDTDIKPLAGYWVTAPCFTEIHQKDAGFILRRGPDNISATEPALVPQDVLTYTEERTGIALNRNRTVKEGHLYSARHVRLARDVSLLAGVVSKHSCSLRPNGILQLGGEQRVCRYRLVQDVDLPWRQGGNLLYTLTPLPTSLDTELQQVPHAAGKLLRVGGWDMQEKFHKSLVSWFPAGSVFVKSEQLERNDQLMAFCITI